MPKERFGAAMNNAENAGSHVPIEERVIRRSDPEKLRQMRVAQISFLDMNRQLLKNARAKKSNRLNEFQQVVTENKRKLALIDSRLRELGFEPEEMLPPEKEETVQTETLKDASDESDDVVSGVQEKPDLSEAASDQEPDLGVIETEKPEPPEQDEQPSEPTVEPLPDADAPPDEATESQPSDEPTPVSGETNTSALLVESAAKPSTESTRAAAKSKFIIEDHWLRERTDLQDQASGLEFRIKQLERSLMNSSLTGKERKTEVIKINLELADRKEQLRKVRSSISAIPAATEGKPTSSYAPKVESPKHAQQRPQSAEAAKTKKPPQPKGESQADAEPASGTRAKRAETKDVPASAEEIAEEHAREDADQARAQLEMVLKTWEARLTHLQETASDETEIKNVRAKVEKILLLIERLKVLAEQQEHAKRIKTFKSRRQKKMEELQKTVNDRLACEAELQIYSEQNGGVVRSDLQVRIKQAKQNEKRIGIELKRLIKGFSEDVKDEEQLGRRAAEIGVQLAGMEQVLLEDAPQAIVPEGAPSVESLAIPAAAVGLALYTEPSVINTTGEEVQDQPTVDAAPIAEKEKKKDEPKEKKEGRLGKVVGTVVLKAWDWTLGGVYQGLMTLYDLGMGRGLKDTWGNMKKRYGEEGKKEK